MPPRLLRNDELEASGTVANCRMNREREIAGTNSYAADLRMDVLGFLTERLEEQQTVAWLDLCCGSARALIQAAESLNQSGFGGRVRIDGIDLVGMFAEVPSSADSLNLQTTSVERWSPTTAYDLITCVHGLHYLGDKLGLLTRAVSWLTEEGLLVANLDLSNLKRTDGKRWSSHLARQLRAAGIEYEPRHRLISRHGTLICEIPYTYAGADDNAGPNCTGQPAVNSYYDAR